jgi:uncharacterized protein YjbI with pentapeptide repeats
MSEPDETAARELGKELRRADLRRRDLTGRDLSGADLALADLRGADLSGARLGKACLSGARLRRARARGADLGGADLVGADLVGADLGEACLVGADLEGVQLDHACLEAADLSKARLVRLSFRRVDLRQATLRDADLTGAQLVDGELAEADLSGAQLEEADLSFADLRGAILTGARLDRANLSGAQLERADLRDASVKGARLSWVLGLDARARRELLARGARVPVSWLAIPWARFNALARQRAGLVYLVGLVLVGALAVATAAWLGRQMAGERVYALNGPDEGVVYEVDCGSAADRVFRGQAGYVGGKPGRAKQAVEIQRVVLAPEKAYLTERHGEEFGYSFRLSPGWYEVQLHFAELFHRDKGSRTFDIRVEDRVVERNFDILAESYFATALVRRFAVFVDDGLLDLRFKRRTARAKVNFIRVRRLDGPAQRTEAR